MKIAIITSSPDNQARPLKDFFSGGNRISVDYIITDSESMAALPMEIPTVLYSPYADARALVHGLKDEGVEMVVFDNFKYEEDFLPFISAEEGFGDNVIFFRQTPEGVTASSLHEVLVSAPAYNDTLLPRAIVSLCDRELHTVTPPPIAQAETPKSIEDEWAETLNIHPSPSTPPPTPENTTTQPSPSAPSSSPSSPASPSTPPPITPNSARPPMPNTYLLWSVLAIIFCCFIPAIVALIYSSQVSSKYYSDDFEGSERASQNAQIWIIISIVTGIVAATLYLPLMLLTA